VHVCRIGKQGADESTGVIETAHRQVDAVGPGGVGDQDRGWCWPDAVDQLPGAATRRSKRTKSTGCVSRVLAGVGIACHHTRGIDGTGITAREAEGGTVINKTAVRVAHISVEASTNIIIAGDLTSIVDGVSLIVSSEHRTDVPHHSVLVEKAVPRIGPVVR